MGKQEQPGKQMRFTRESFERLSKSELIDIILRQQEQIESLTARVEELERRLGMNSQNSSNPPSSDPPGTERRQSQPKKGSKRKRGGQPGHQGHCRSLLPAHEVDKIIPVKPRTCERCGGRLKGEDLNPRREQKWDLPQIRPYVEEYQLHTLNCAHCGARTTAQLPQGIPRGAFLPRAQATVALLTGAYRMSKRMARSILEDFFHLPISLGSIPACEAAVSEALAAPMAQARQYVASADVLYADETGFRECNRKAWLWTAATSMVTIFMLHASRGRAAAQVLLGGFSGILVSDRWHAYNFYSGPRQLCWAHLQRDFTAFSEFKGTAGEIGAHLVAKVKLMFQWWHRVRDGTLQRSTFQRYLRKLRREVEEFLRQGTVCAEPKIARSCKRILKQARFLWTFVEVEGVEPTNNAAERAVRPVVLWRKGSFGTQSAQGSRFFERIMTAAATCKLQGRNIVEYVTAACLAHLQGRSVPSLLPTTCASAA